MVKIVLTAEIMKLIEKNKSFLDRSHIELFTAHSNDDVLRIHRIQKADIIITTLHWSGMKVENLCSTIRADEALRKVSVIIICPNNAEDIMKSSLCNPAAVITKPVVPEKLLEKVQQLMDISARDSYRVAVEVLIEAANMDKPFFGRSMNISTSGILIETKMVLEKGSQV